MAKPRILVFAGSIRTGALSGKLAALAAKELTLSDSEVSLISLSDYPMPIYDGDLEAREGAPANAKKLRAMMLAHRGVFIVTPEYNSSFPPLLKNAIDWVSRAKEPAASPFRECVFALGSTSDGWRGGYRAITAFRQVLELGLETLVVPEMISVPGAASAFNQAGDLKEERWAKQLRRTLDRLVVLCQAER